MQGAGWSRELLLGSVAVEDWPRTGRTSIAKRSPSCASLQSASCSENFVIPPEVIGQLLELLERVQKYWHCEKELKGWSLKPNLTPKVLLAVALKPKHREIIASLKILVSDAGVWVPNLVGDGRVVPVDIECDENKNLDFLGIRGRKLKTEPALKLGNHPTRIGSFFHEFKCQRPCPPAPASICRAAAARAAVRGRI